MNVGSKTLLPSFFTALVFGVGFSSNISKGLEAFRFRDGRVLGGSGDGTGFLVGVFFAADVPFGASSSTMASSAGASFTTALLEPLGIRGVALGLLVVFLGGGVSSSLS